MQPLSKDLRKRILEAVDNKEGSRRGLAARYRVNASTITELLRLRRETVSFEPRPHGGGVEPIVPRRLGFVDETAVTTAMTPAYGRAPRGGRVEASAPASWESVTVIAAMGLDGVRAPLAFEGAVNAATFLTYVERTLVPALHRGDVVIFDNVGSHLSSAVFEAIEGAGACVLPLPPYGPDFNPIEEMLSKFKESLRRIGARAEEHLYEAIGEGLREVTPRDILGWLGHAAPCVMQA